MRGPFALFLCLAASSAHAAGLETVLVTAEQTEPHSGQSLSADDLARSGTADMLRGLDEQMAGVSLANAQNNPYQPGIAYRGFAASPLQGDAQGLAVYLDGTRLNQMFGETVNWDVISDNALAQARVEDANPLYGLNALGGAIVLRSKNGFDGDIATASAEAASFNHYQEEFQFGRSFGDTAIFLSGTKIDENGWRAHSPSHLGKLFGNLAWQIGPGQIQLDLMGASNALTGNGTSPVELLAADRHAVFTYPDETRNDYGLVNLIASYPLANGWTLRSNLHLSALRQRTLNGDASDADVCEDTPGLLCLDDDFLTDRSGAAIPDFLAGGPYAQLNRTTTSTTSLGTTLEASWQGNIASFANALTFGFSYDRGVSAFAASSEIGALTPDRGFADPGPIIDQSDGSIAPVSVKGVNAYLGLYVTDTLDLTDKLSLTAAGRFNRAEIALDDRLGEALNGDHSYTRFNPSIKLTYKALQGIDLFAGYSETNRAPSPAEFSCADPAAPCSLTNFFVGDPPLKQVVARTFEAGGYGTLVLEGDQRLAWQAELYRTNVSDDIELVASSVIGRGYFRNVASTRRQGLEASLRYELERISATLGYSYTDATYLTAFPLNSPENPMAGEDGVIFVGPGDHLPNIPAHLVKAVVSYSDNGLTLSLAARAASGQYLEGDEANLNARTASYFVMGTTADYRLTPHMELFAGVDNVFNRSYATFGGFSPTSDVPLAEAPGASNPRSLSPAPPRSFYGGLRATF